MNKEIETREKLHELLQDALLNEDEDQVYTMTLDRLRHLDEVKGVDEELSDFARTLAEDLNDENEEERELVIAPRRGSPSFPARKSKKKLSGREKRIVGVSASLLVLFIAIFAMTMMETEPVTADPNQNKVVQNQGDMVVINGESYEDLDAVVCKTWEDTSWSNIENAKKFLPELLVPQYMLEGYEFKNLYIEKFENGKYHAEYQFAKKDKNLTIVQSSAFKGDADLFNIQSGIIKTALGDFRLTFNEEHKTLAAYLDVEECTLRIAGEVSEDEIKKIAENLE